jgi:hypothetical protein
MKYLHEGDSVQELIRNAQRTCAVKNLPKAPGGRYWKIVLLTSLADQLRQELASKTSVVVSGVVVPGIRRLQNDLVNFDERFVAILDEMFVCEAGEG